jgi:hypothetical protein
MSESKIRVWLASLTMGLATSLMLIAAMSKMGVAFYFPPLWPGLFFALVSGAIWPGHSSSRIGLVLVVAGNTAFYAWIFLKALRAEVAARGSFSRYFLR